MSQCVNRLLLAMRFFPPNLHREIPPPENEDTGFVISLLLFMMRLLSAAKMSISFTVLTNMFFNKEPFVQQPKIVGCERE